MLFRKLGWIRHSTFKGLESGKKSLSLADDSLETHRMRAREHPPHRCTCWIQPWYISPLLKKIPYPDSPWLMNKSKTYIYLDFCCFLLFFFCLSPLFFTELCYSQSKRLMMFGSGLFQDQSSSFFPRLQWEVNSGPVWKPGFTCSSGLDRGTWCSASPLWN